MNRSKLGEQVLSLLDPKPGERILDVGSGNGDLTAKIAATGAIPTGIDLSEAMAERANQKYPELDIQAADICRYRTDDPYDAVFSHAVLHWIKDADAAVRSIWLALKPGGRFVAEFAGSGNVAILTGAIRQALEAHGYSYAGRSPWYLPTIGQYAALLEGTGFRVLRAEHFDSASPLPRGVREWLDSFAGYFFADVPAADRATIYRVIEETARPYLERGGIWMADTSRLRVVAVKNND